MSCALVVQTCDKYQRYWSGFFNFMGKHWSPDIPMYFCNEESEVDLPHGFIHLKTGKGTFVENLKSALDEIQEENIFYMLEDFWPTAPLGAEMFQSLYGSFIENKMDVLQVSSYLPYYSLSRSEIVTCGRNLLEFKKSSEWRFNFQARFWRKELLMESLVEPKVSESKVGSAITVEMECDKRWEERDLRIFLFHYHWYPIGGVAYRGGMTEIGRQMENVVMIDDFVRDKFS